MRISISTPELSVLALVTLALLGGAAAAHGWTRAAGVHWKLAAGGFTVLALVLTLAGLAIVAGEVRISIIGAAELGLVLAAVWLVEGMFAVGGILWLPLPLPARAALAVFVLPAMFSLGLMLALGLAGTLDLRPLPSASACDALLARLGPLNAKPGTAIEVPLPKGSRWMTANGRVYVLRTADGRAYLWGRTMWRWHDNYDGFLYGRDPLEPGEIRTARDEDRDEGREIGDGWIEFAGVTEPAPTAPDPAAVVGAIVRRRAPVFYEVRSFNALN
jgi:hypothetical protein